MFLGCNLSSPGLVEHRHGGMDYGMRNARRQDMLETREGGCHCGRVRFRAAVDLDLLSQCNCTICTKKGILHLPAGLDTFELLRGKTALKAYTFGTGVAQHTFCSQCGMHAFYIPRAQPHRISVNARCLDGIDGPSLKPNRVFDGRHWEDAQHRRIAETGHAPPAGAHGAKTLQAILDRAPE
jgi:hypothetical protein